VLDTITYKNKKGNHSAYKQLGVETNRTSFLFLNRSGIHNMERQAK